MNFFGIFWKKAAEKTRDEVLAELKATTEKEMRVGGNECSICLDIVPDDTIIPRKVVRLSCCKDVFHLPCLERWLSVDREGVYESRCPGCKKHQYADEQVLFSLLENGDRTVTSRASRSSSNAQPPRRHSAGQPLRRAHSTHVRRPSPNEHLQNAEILMAGIGRHRGGPWAKSLVTTVRAHRFAWHIIVDLRRSEDIPAAVPRRALHAAETNIRKELRKINGKDVALGIIQADLILGIESAVLSTPTNGTLSDKEEVQTEMRQWATKLACKVIESVCEIED